MSDFTVTGGPGADPIDYWSRPICLAPPQPEPGEPATDDREPQPGEHRDSPPGSPWQSLLTLAAGGTAMALQSAERVAEVAAEQSGVFRIAARPAVAAAAAETGVGSTWLRVMGLVALRSTWPLLLVGLKGDGGDRPPATPKGAPPEAPQPAPEVAPFLDPNEKDPRRPMFLQRLGEPGTGFLPAATPARTPDDTRPRASASSGKPPPDSMRGDDRHDETEPPEREKPARAPQVVPLSIHAEVPAWQIKDDEDFLPSYYRLHEQLAQTPAIDHATEAIPDLGEGRFSAAYTYRSSPTLAYKIPKETYAREVEITPAAMRMPAYEGVTINRVEAVGVQVARVHGLVPVSTPEGLAVGLMMEKIHNAINLKDERNRTFALNTYARQPRWQGYMVRYADAVSRVTLQDLDRTTDLMLTHGFTLRDRQELLARKTSHAYLIDPLQLDPWNAMSHSRILENMELRNALAQLIGAPVKPLPATSGITFRQWWDGDFNAYRSTLW